MKKSAFLTCWISIKHIRATVLLLIISVIGSAEAQNILTLERCISRSLASGYAVRTASAEYRASKNNYESARRKLRTSVAVSFDLPNYQESLSNQFDPLQQQYKYYELTTTRVQGTLTINQPILFTGGALTVSEYMFGRDQTNGNSASSPGKDYFNNVLVEYKQPLFTTNLLRVNDERTLLAFEQAQTDFAKSQLDIIYNVTESFYAAYQAEQRVGIVQEQVRQNTESYQTAKRKFEFGLIPEVEALQSEVDLAGSQNDLLNASRDVERAKNALRMLIGAPLGEAMTLVAELSYVPIKIDSIRVIETALANRAEVRSADRSIRQHTLNVEATKARSEFRIDVTATYGFNKSASDPNDLLHTYARSRSAALSVSMPLFDWGAHSYEVQAAEVQFGNALETKDYVQNQVRQEVLDLLGRIRAAASRIGVLEKNVAVAQKGYDISSERFGTGAIGRNDLAQAQQRLTTTKLNSLSALIDYKLGIADLKRKTLFDVELQQPVVPVNDSQE